MAGTADEPVTGNVRITKKVFKELSVVVFPYKARQKNTAIEMRQIGRHIGGTAQHGLHGVHLINRYGRFRRNAFHLAVYIPIDHDIADNGNAQLRQPFVQKIIDIPFRRRHPLPALRPTHSFHFPLNASAPT